jgi:circadian clock protein KaiC
MDSPRVPPRTPTPARVRARRSRGRSSRTRRSRELAPLAKAPSGIRGLDEITLGGLPRGRPTLVCGGAGSGKTLFAMEFLVRGAVDHGEPGVFMSFEESEADLAANVASLGFDVRRLEAQGKLAIDHVRIERSEIEETGEYDLSGLFVRLQHAIDTVGAKRVALDTIESLFSGLPNLGVLRAELRRLFQWLKDRGLTVVLTGEKGDGGLTRHGLEEYVSDCVIFLDHRVTDQVSTRRVRIVKYRGSTHGTNEYPFLIDESGISVLPITSLGLAHEVSTERVSTGIARLDEMFGGKGYYKGSTILCSGTAGTGKTSLAAHLVAAACARGQRCLYFAFEESSAQLVRNMRSVGIDLARWIDDGKLRIVASRPHASGLETHLLHVHRYVDTLRPAVVVLDPITNLVAAGTELDARSMLTRLIDFLKSWLITSFFTSLTAAGGEVETSDVGISSLIDTWLLLDVVRSGGERNRTLTVVKSRGMPHSNQATEYRLTSDGLELMDTYLGPSGVLTGSARLAKEAEDRATAQAQQKELARKQTLRERRRRAFEARLEAMREEHEAEDATLEREIEESVRQREQLDAERSAMGRSRHAFAAPSREGRRRGEGRRS